MASAPSVPWSGSGHPGGDQVYELRDRQHQRLPVGCFPAFHGGYDRAHGHLLLHLPDRGLCDRRVSGQAGGPEGSSEADPFRHLLPPDGARSHQPLRRSEQKSV